MNSSWWWTASRNCSTRSVAGSTPNTTPIASGPTTPPTPAPAVTQATTQMSDAGDAARDLAHKLDRAQQHLAHLGTQPATRLDPPADLPACSTRPQVVPCSWQHGGPFTLASDSRDR